MRLVMYMFYKETPIDLILCHLQPSEVGPSGWYTLADHLWYRLAGDLWYSDGRHLTIANDGVPGWGLSMIWAAAVWLFIGGFFMVYRAFRDRRD